MATLALNNGIATMDPQSGLAELYGKLYQTMHNANQVELPDYSQNPPTTSSGEIDQAALRQKIIDDGEIMMKNSAYEWAKAIMTTMSGNSSGGASGVGFVSRNGDNMLGALGALYGFQGGHDNELILELTHDGALVSDAFAGRVAKVYGHLRVDGDATVDGQLNMGDTGIFFSKHQTIWYADNKLQIDSQDIKITGAVEVDGSLKLGNVTINSNGVFNCTSEYYHSGNCNNSTTDWDMHDAHVYGDLTVDGSQTFNGRLTAIHGFTLGENTQWLMYSVDPNDTNATHTPPATKNDCYVQLESDLNLWTDYAISFDKQPILKVKSGTDKIVSLCAPGMILNLGDGNSTLNTKEIRLQADIYQFNGDFAIVSKSGYGNFRGGFEAWTGTTGSEVIKTYTNSSDDIGVLFKKNVRLNSLTGPLLSAPVDSELNVTMPYVFTDENGLTNTKLPLLRMYFAETTSLFKAQNTSWSASLVFDLDPTVQGDSAEFFSFRQAVESKSFSIISTKYKTRLTENVLFFHDGIFMEGIFNDAGADGIRHSGNSYFDGNVGTMRFSGGFVGYGWAVINNNKSYCATFDELTVRKRMRVYELEVQKQSVTNGSWWVTDSCSGDIVEKLN